MEETSACSLLKGMDEAGVDVAMLSAPPPASEIVTNWPAALTTAMVNDDLLAISGRHPDRFLTAICLPAFDVDAAYREVIRCAGHESVRAVCLTTSAGGTGLDGPEYVGLYRLCAELGLVVLLHPSLDEISAQFAEWNLHSALGAPVATAVTAIRLALSGILDEIPDLQVILPHLGGVLPFLLARVEEQSRSSLAREDLSFYCRERFFYDTCSFHPPALRCAVDTVGVDRLLLGSDFPFRGSLQRAVEDLTVNLSERERHIVLVDNPGRLLLRDTARAKTGI
jgi:predicted TIM-barrel fold metal-dependent hydrolase